MGAQAPTYDERGQRKPHGNNHPAAAIRVPDVAVMRDFARARLDIPYFAERWLGVRLNPGQRRWVEACAQRAEDGWRPKYLTTVVSAGNRAGKTLAMAVIVLHHTLYKLGTKPAKLGDREDSLRWLRSPYHWYHIGHQQEIAELVHHEAVMLLRGDHLAQQGRGCPLTDTLGQIVTTDKKYRGEYLWLRFHEMFGAGEVHFRTTQEKAKALLGKDMNGISFDEAAFELYLDTIYQEVLNLRRLSTGGPLHFVSTPTEGVNAYADLWELGSPENPSRDAQVASFRLSTRENIGYGLTQENYDAIVRQQAEYLIPQNIDGMFIEAREAFFHAPTVEAIFDTEMEPEAAPVKGHRYVQGVDPGIASDATWAITLDYSERPWQGVRARKRGGRQSLPAIVNMVREGHLLYGSEGAFCASVVDNTGLGGKLFQQEFSIIKPLRTFDFAGTKAKKLNLLSDLKAIIDRGDLHLPRSAAWLEVRRQLLGYKLDDRKIEQDAVMALAMAVRHASRNPAVPLENPMFDYFGGSD